MVSVTFLGSHPLGEACLERLVRHEAVSVELVVTYPRDHDGWWDGSVHERALEHGLRVEPIANEHRITEYDVDYLFSVYYPNVLGPDLLEHPARCALNLHQAELPRYRGSNVFSHSIMNAREDDHWRHGTTLHVMAEAVDEGDVVARKFVPITEDDTAGDLYERTRRASIALFEEQLPAIVAGEVREMARPQADVDGERYFYAKDSLEGLKAIDGAQLGTDDPATERAVYDRIRALDFPPHEPAWTRLDDR
jgi:methionyl-tRNA formyltransferase